MKFILNEESGQSMVEYALILSLVFLAALMSVVLTGKEITNIYTDKIDPILNKVFSN